MQCFVVATWNIFNLNKYNFVLRLYPVSKIFVNLAVVVNSSETTITPNITQIFHVHTLPIVLNIIYRTDSQSALRGQQIVHFDWVRKSEVNE